MATPTYYAKVLVKEIQKRGIDAKLEYEDGHKSVDIHIPKVNLDIEVDGRHHAEDPEQALRDLIRTKFSLEDGRNTIRIPNTLVYNNPEVTANLIKEIVDGIEERSKKGLKEKSKHKSSKEKTRIKRGTTVGEFVSKERRENFIKQLKRVGMRTKNTVSFTWRLTKSFFHNGLKSLIFLFLFPLVYYVFAYALLILSIILLFIVSLLGDLLFAVSWRTVIENLTGSFAGSFVIFVKDLAPSVWNFVYFSQTRPFVVSIVLIISLLYSYIKLVKNDRRRVRYWKS